MEELSWVLEDTAVVLTPLSDRCVIDGRVMSEIEGARELAKELTELRGAECMGEIGDATVCRLSSLGEYRLAASGYPCGPV